jgi:hypothetical protein
MLIAFYLAILLSMIAIHSVAASPFPPFWKHILPHDDVDPDWAYSLSKASKEASVSQSMAWPD